MTMFSLVGLCFGMVVRFFFRRRSLLLENLALRQQLVALKRRHPRPSLGLLDKLFWVIARRVWSGWKQALLVVTPETVVRWHRAGFRYVLEANFQSPEAGWKETDAEGDSGIDFPDGCREPNLGSTTDPWGTPHARF
jgi:hypothetical protein